MWRQGLYMLVIELPYMVTDTICPGSSDPFYLVTYYIKWGHYFLDIQYDLLTCTGHTFIPLKQKYIHNHEHFYRKKTALPINLIYLIEFLQVIARSFFNAISDD